MVNFNQALVVEWREANSLVLRAAGSILPLRYAQVFGQAIGYLIPIVTNGLPRAEGLVPWGLRSLQVNQKKKKKKKHLQNV